MLCWYKSFSHSLAHMRHGYQKQQPPSAWILPVPLALAVCALSSWMHWLQAILHAYLWTIRGLLCAPGTQRVRSRRSATTPLLLAFCTGLVQVLMPQVWDGEEADTSLVLWHSTGVITYWNTADEIWYQWMQINAAWEKRFKGEGFFIGPKLADLWNSLVLDTVKIK